METPSKAQRETVGADAGRLSSVIGEGDTHPARDPTPPVLTPVGVRAIPVLTDESLSDAERHQEHVDLPPRLEISTYYYSKAGYNISQGSLWFLYCAFIAECRWKNSEQ